jgi:OmpA-OmpF porin, OOP family
MQPHSIRDSASLASIFWFTAIFLAIFLMAGCATEVNNPALERARESYTHARQDRDLVARAGVALERARLTLEQAERVWTADKDVVEVEHLAYLAEKRVEIARAVARRRLAVEELQRMGTR